MDARALHLSEHCPAALQSLEWLARRVSSAEGWDCEVFAEGE